VKYLIGFLIGLGRFAIFWLLYEAAMPYIDPEINYGNAHENTLLFASFLFVLSYFGLITVGKETSSKS
jgi:hypothetical protein